MTNLIALLVGPILLLASIPLALFAAFTSALAFSTLIVHVLIVYAELAAVLMRNQFSSSNAAVSSKSYCNKSQTTTGTTTTTTTTTTTGHPSTTGSLTPKIPSNTTTGGGLGIFSSSSGDGLIERDFEGVGGWRIPGSEDDDVLWTSMNSRLELPAIPDDRKRHHQRSLTSGSITSTPLITRSSMRSLKKNHTIANAGEDAGSAGSAGYFFDSGVNANVDLKPKSKSAGAVVDSTSGGRRESLCRGDSVASMGSVNGEV